MVLGTKGGAARDVEDASAVIDAEFLFLSGGKPWSVKSAGAREHCAWGDQEQQGRAGQHL